MVCDSSSLLDYKEKFEEEHKLLLLEFQAHAYTKKNLSHQQAKYKQLLEQHDKILARLRELEGCYFNFLFLSVTAKHDEKPLVLISKTLPKKEKHRSPHSTSTPPTTPKVVTDKNKSEK